MELSRSESSCAASVGRPRVKVGEASGVIATLTAIKWDLVEVRELCEAAKADESAVASGRGPSSALTPQTSEVFPMRTNDEPFALVMDPIREVRAA